MMFDVGFLHFEASTGDIAMCSARSKNGIVYNYKPCSLKQIVWSTNYC